MKNVAAALVLILVASNVASATAGIAMSDFDHALVVAMDRMQAAMNAAPIGGTPDHDFLVMMIPHHQAAIDMAKSELQYGHDVRAKRLAQEIIVNQQSEIQLMQSYLADDASSKKGEK